MTTSYGATLNDWNHFSMLLGLTADLLPVVSNPDAVISPQSTMKVLGKTPSMYYGSHAGGIKVWTQKQTTPDEITRWAQQPDYGICIQTRSVRALDIDIEDPTISEAVQNEFYRAINIKLPTRSRDGTGKKLQPFTLDGDYSKRAIKTDHGIIEFLATGQQFVAIGTHPSGVRYDWIGGLPEDIPVVPAERFEAAWKHLNACFGIGESAESQPTRRHTKVAEAISNDPIAQYLIDQGLALSTERDGRIHLVCPFAAEHTSDSAESGTTYFPARTGGYERGHFKCLHAHCEQRTRSDFLAALEYDENIDDFDELGETDSAAPAAGDEAAGAKARYTLERAEDFSSRTAPEWIVKGVLPRAALACVFGAPGSGKTFLALDLALAVARGEDWRGQRVRQGTVVYIAAEDATGVQHRTTAYSRERECSLTDLPLFFLAESPNFMVKDDVADVAKAIHAIKQPVSLIFIDTWAQVTPGANENSGEDMGKAMGYCRLLHRATGAMIVLIHHSGKDSTKGARGWSGLYGAADCMLEVSRYDDDREAIVFKQKNAADGGRFGFRLKIVTLGVDEDGDNITSCVIEHMDAALVDRTKKKALGPNQRALMRAHDELTVGDGSTVMRDELLTRATDMIDLNPLAKSDKRRSNLGRALTDMVNDGYFSDERGVITKVREG